MMHMYARRPVVCDAHVQRGVVLKVQLESCFSIRVRCSPLALAMGS